VDERTLRVAALAGAADLVLLCSLESVCYATGYGAAPELGPSPHAGGPNVALVARDGSTTLIVPDLEGEDAAASRANRVITYETFANRPHAAPLSRLLADAVEAEVRGARVAVEHGAMPALWRLDVAGDVTPGLTRARATKTAEEIAQLRECARLTAVGQAQALQAEPGMTELEVFGAIRGAIEAEAGAPFVLGVDLLSGVERTAEAMGAPGLRVLQEGDPVLCDLGPRVGGYWGDSCNTFVLGEPSAAFLSLRTAVERAIERACEVIRPGIAAGVLDALVREPIERAGYVDPLHIGHAIGTANFEFPRVVPGEPARLEPGMVLMIEPGAYAPGIGGARLEWMFLVTETGNEVLSPYGFPLRKVGRPI
jgi:Xaa-Pro aminopeptidase